MSEERRTKWIVVLPWASFPIVGALMSKAEAEEAARLIWWNAEIEE